MLSIEANPFFVAVAIIPVPNGLVKIIESLTFASEFRHILCSSTSPVTTRPYLGSLSSTE